MHAVFTKYFAKYSTHSRAFKIHGYATNTSFGFWLLQVSLVSVRVPKSKLLAIVGAALFTGLMSFLSPNQ